MLTWIIAPAIIVAGFVVAIAVTVIARRHNRHIG
jgi:hypothetical protein